MPIDSIAGVLFELPGVSAVALGGSRAQGVNRPDSDWDVAIYYRHGFDPQSVRDIGWRGNLSEIGGWGRIFNGGGKVTVADQSLDIHYRDLTLIDEIHEASLRGRFTVEPLLFHQAGIPSYILLAELGINRTLRGTLPTWDYPAALRTAAPPLWWDQALHTLEYADRHARDGRSAQCAGLLSEASCRAAHAILAHRGVWVTNEKQLLDKAGIRRVDGVVADMDGSSESLTRAVSRARGILLSAGHESGLPWL